GARRRRRSGVVAGDLATEWPVGGRRAVRGGDHDEHHLRRDEQREGRVPAKSAHVSSGGRGASQTSVSNFDTSNSGACRAWAAESCSDPSNSHGAQLVTACNAPTTMRRRDRGPPALTPSAHL